MYQYEIVKQIMVIFVVVYFLLDIVLNLNDIDNDTSNVIMLSWSKKVAFFLPFVLGVIGGYLFLDTTNRDIRFSDSMYSVLILAGIVVIMLIIGWKMPFKKTKLFLSTLLFLGVLYRYFFWSMNNEIVLP